MELDDFMQNVADYWKAKNWLFNYFGYKEDWVTIPLHTQTIGLWWFINGARDETGAGGEVIFQYQDDEEYDPKDVEDGNCVSWPIYTQRFLPKWVYRGKDYTMVVVNTQTDGNKYLAVFSNELEVKDAKEGPTFNEQLAEMAKSR